jgi:hypothetical protein
VHFQTGKGKDGKNLITCLPLSHFLNVTPTDFFDLKKKRVKKENFYVMKFLELDSHLPNPFKQWGVSKRRYE